jgi:hypothetical protein
MHLVGLGNRLVGFLVGLGIGLGFLLFGLGHVFAGLRLLWRRRRFEQKQRWRTGRRSGWQ